MPRLPKAELRGRVIGALQEAGWNISEQNDGHPFEITARDQEGTDRHLRVYAWNISHGGASRSEDEYRIQLTPPNLSPLQIDAVHQTALLGVAETDHGDVVVAFDPRQHQTFGSSASVQVQRQTIEAAAETGLAFEHKDLPNGDSEIVVAMRQENLPQYLQEIHPAYHAGNAATSNAEGETVEALDFTQPELTDEALQDVPVERRRSLRRAAHWVRDQNFCRRVKHVYGHRCAMCGLQANMVQAAHILAVQHNGTDEVRNGMALCPNHHEAYDRGLLVVDQDGIIRKNGAMEQALREADLDQGLDEFFASARVGEQVHLPTHNQYHPNPNYLDENLEQKGRENFY